MGRDTNIRAAVGGEHFAEHLGGTHSLLTIGLLDLGRPQWVVLGEAGLDPEIGVRRANIRCTSTLVAGVQPDGLTPELIAVSLLHDIGGRGRRAPL